MTKYSRLLLIVFVVGFACSLFVPAGEALRLPRRIAQTQPSNPIVMNGEFAIPTIRQEYARTNDNRPNAPAGTITVISHYQQNQDTGMYDIPGSQTFTLSKRVFTSNDCTTGGGPITTVTGVNSSTGHVINLASGSVLLSPAAKSDQNGNFAGAWIPASGNFGNFTGVAGGFCVASTVTDTFKAIYNAGVVLFDSATCNTPKTDYNLTETVCAKIYGNPKSYCPVATRAFNVIFTDPAAQTRQTSPDLTADLQTTTYALPTTNTEGTAGDNRGGWKADLKAKCGLLQGNQPFFVHNPGAPAAHASITKNSATGQVQNGGTMEYDIRVFNFNGPDPANGVVWTDILPAGMTFHSLTRISGPAFNCTTPAVGANGTITCTAQGPLQRASITSDPNVAAFRLVLKNTTASSPKDNTANVTSSTTDLPSTTFSNTATASVIVSSNCSFTDGCVPDMVVTPNTTCPDGNPGRIVNWGNPVTNPANPGGCTIAPNPGSGSCFSAGTTTVTYNSASGSATCSFRITVLASPTASDSDVRGTIVDNIGQPVEGVTVKLDGAQTRKTITDANGQYQFDHVETNGLYTVTPSRTNFAFSPSTRSFSQIGQSTEAVFTATPINDGSNPIDSPEYFVRQHYLDFLGREPDEAGFNFWSNQMLECGTDASCAGRRKVNVSAAYFMSIEFKQTGGLVDGLYRASFGRAPRYAEFIPETRLVARGVVVGRGDWALQLEQNKQAFVDAWLERGDFHAAYGNLSNAAFVDRLISNTNGFNGDRDALVNGLNGGLTRSAVLRQIVENEGFVQAKTNGMFVLIEYFGYLRRDPDEAGYQFWLNKLNQFGGNFEQAEMVKAFIESGEYRARF